MWKPWCSWCVHWCHTWPCSFRPFRPVSPHEVRTWTAAHRPCRIKRSLRYSDTCRDYCWSFFFSNLLPECCCFVVCDFYVVFSTCSSIASCRILCILLTKLSEWFIGLWERNRLDVLSAFAELKNRRENKSHKGDQRRLYIVYSGWKHYLEIEKFSHTLIWKCRKGWGVG